MLKLQVALLQEIFPHKKKKFETNDDPQKNLICNICRKNEFRP